MPLRDFLKKSIQSNRNSLNALIEMFSIFFIGFYLLVIFLLVKRSPLLVSMVFLFLFTSLWRFTGSVYMDFGGPIESWELSRAIGGHHGWFSTVCLFSYLLVLIPLLVVFSRKRIDLLNQWQQRSSANVTHINGIRIETFIACIMGSILLLLYIELFMIGDIPFFSGTERWLYSREKAGLISKFLGVYLTGPLCWLTGYAWYLAIIKKRKKLAGIILFLLFACIVYFLLLGNKFSTPLYAAASFLLSAGTIFLTKTEKKLIQKRIVQIIVLGLVLFGMLFGTMYKVYFIDRGYKLKYFYAFFEQRALIAPSQLVWSAYERIFSQSDYRPLETIDLAIIHPLPLDSNPAVNYLMYRELGPSVFNMKTGFTDAYPGIVFELFGPYLAFPAIFLLGFAFASSLYRLAKYTVQQKVMPATLYFFLVQAFTMFFAQGQLLFLTSLRFYIKIAAVYLIMQFIRRRLIIASAKPALMVHASSFEVFKS